MKRYCINPNYLVCANEEQLLFFTPTNPPGIISTALWKYQADTLELHRCFEITGSLLLWKYPVENGDIDLQYIGIQYPGIACVIGIGFQGEIVFRVEPGKTVDVRGPVFDALGNIILSVDGQWIFCLSPKGTLLWKWKAIFPVTGVCEIEKYWVFQEKLYVIACGLLYVISLSGNVEESYVIYEFPYKPIQCQVCEEYILFIDLRSGNLFCHNLKGELIWQFSAGRGEKLLRIITCEHNRICLKAIRNEDKISILYVLDENGKICWNTCEEWNELYILSAKDILLVNGKDLSIYNAKGRNILKSNVKKNIIYANVWGNHLRMIVESRGKISVVEQDIESNSKPLCIKLPDVEDNAVKIENEISWENELIEYLIMNLALFCRYLPEKIMRIRIICELFSFMKICVQTDKGIWKSAMAKDIPYEEIVEEDIDGYKECCYKNDVIWIEFCDVHSEEVIKVIMGAVCDLLSQREGIEVNLFFM